MTTTTTATSSTRSAPSTAPTLVPAVRAAFVLLVLAQVAIVVFTLWEPPFDGEIRYDDIVAVRDAYWPMNVLLGGPAYALSAVTATVFLVVLGVGRGQALSLIGSVLNLLGGLVFALVITAEVLPFAWAANPSNVDEAQGRALFAAYNDRFDAFLPYVLGSMVVVALGALLAVVGAAVSGGLRWWVPALVLVLVIGQFALPFGHPLMPALSLAERLVWVYLGWAGLRAVLRRG